jgi:hypothetical protein
MQSVQHKGSCHCGAVQFTVVASPHLIVWNCNCTICSLKQNHHFIVPATAFEIERGLEELTTYTFNTHVAQHKFCRKCGVQAFYHPRSNPDGVAVTVGCVQPGTIKTVTTRFYDGKNWEAAHSSTGIASCSKE